MPIPDFQRLTLPLSQRGCDVRAEGPPAVNISYITRFPEYLAFRQPRANGTPTANPSPAEPEARTPDDLLEERYEQRRTVLVAEIGEHIAAMSPDGFEQLIVDVLRAMGYGGPQDDAGLVVGRGGDEGTAGVIKEDGLGRETVYIPAKRYKGSALGRACSCQRAGLRRYKVQRALNDVRSSWTLIPQTGEQCTIVDYIDCETARIDRLITNIEATIEGPRDYHYRTTRITAAVAGGIDVQPTSLSSVPRMQRC